MRVIRRALSLVAACAALATWAACASVLGVDKTYVLGGADGGSEGRSDGGPSEGDGGGASGIRCAQGGPTCTAGPQECCFASDKSLSCISAAVGCNDGTDILCDEPSQCSGGQACCISLQTAGNDLLGTACMASCPSPQITLCARTNGTCAGGLQCKPLTVGAPFGSDWFYGCQ